MSSLTSGIGGVENVDGVRSVFICGIIFCGDNLWRCYLARLEVWWEGDECG